MGRQTSAVLPVALRAEETPDSHAQSLDIALLIQAAPCWEQCQALNPQIGRRM